MRMKTIYSYKEYPTLTNIGERLICQEGGSVFEGVVEMVSKRGANIRLDNGAGVRFVKWQNVQQLHKKGQVIR